MKKLIKIYNDTPLILRIIIGLILGVIMGIIFPGCDIIKLLGEIFVGALKAIAPILVFILIISALSKNSEKFDSRFSLVIFLYMLSTLFASLTAVVGSFLFPQDLMLDGTNFNNTTSPSNIKEVIYNLLYSMVQNPIQAISEGKYTGILFWAIIFGLGFRKIAKNSTKEFISDTSDVVSTIVSWIINLAPVGIMGLVFSSISSNGLSIFATYGKLILLLVGCMLTVAFIINPLIVFLTLRINPYPLVLKCILKSGVTAFFVRSSAANIPVNMTLCEELELDKKLYSVSIPLGATINMNGAAITIAVMTLACAHTMGIQVDILSAILLSLLATIAACGASGVSGGSLLLIPMACALFGISQDIAIQVIGIGFIIGVIQDSFETALNSSGDVIFAATAEYKNRQKENIPLPKFLS